MDDFLKRLAKASDRIVDIGQPIFVIVMLIMLIWALLK